MVSSDYFSLSEITSLEDFLFSIRAKANDLCQGLVNHSLTPIIKPVVYFSACHSWATGNQAPSWLTAVIPLCTGTIRWELPRDPAAGLASGFCCYSLKGKGRHPLRSPGQRSRRPFKGPGGRELIVGFHLTPICCVILRKPHHLSVINFFTCRFTLVMIFTSICLILNLLNQVFSYHCIGFSSERHGLFCSYYSLFPKYNGQFYSSDDWIYWLITVLKIEQVT